MGLGSVRVLGGRGDGLQGMGFVTRQQTVMVTWGADVSMLVLPAHKPLPYVCDTHAAAV